MQDLGDIMPGDICWQLAQKAQIDPGEKIPKGKIKLIVNDEHGSMIKVELFLKTLFEDQFFKDDVKPDQFFRKVQVDTIEGNTVYCYKLDFNDRPIGNVFGINRKIFFQTYFIPQHQMGNAEEI